MKTAKNNRHTFNASRLLCVLLACCCVVSLPLIGRAEVPSGSENSAKTYYARLANTLDFSSSDQIFATTLDDVTAYLGYSGLSAKDMQDLPPGILMAPLSSLTATNASEATKFENAERLSVALANAPLREGDVLVTRFFAPKIMNIKLPEDQRPTGWRKLLRLRARSGSAAEKHHIGYGVILFNFVAPPGAAPFQPGDESKNTQVMLVTDLASIPEPNSPGPASLYWLDYRPLSDHGGTLSLALEQTFDADDLPPSNTNGTKSYFVPDGCVACHGGNPRRALVNYLDTDHWFDRLDTDFGRLKGSGQALLFDAQTNDTNSQAYKNAFDVIAKFNHEADAEVRIAQPTHDEVLASAKWLEVHSGNYSHVSPTDRAIGDEPRWSSSDTNDVQTLAVMNQFCFRCHGTVKFSVFNKQEIRRPEFRALIDEAIRADTPPKTKMPTDRPLPEDVRQLIHAVTQ